MADEPIAKIKKLEESIEALESRNAFQDDMIEQLNQELQIHQDDILELKAQLKEAGLPIDGKKAELIERLLTKGDDE